MAYVCIDTDMRPPTSATIARGEDVLISEIDFQPNERVEASVNPADYTANLDHSSHQALAADGGRSRGLGRIVKKAPARFG